jgi:hypothetical protein
MKTYLSRSWISPKLIPGKSKIHGNGVIVAAPIRQGEKIMEFGGLTISGKEAASENYRVRSIWMAADDVFLALPLSDTQPSLDENLNHSCDANSWLVDEVSLVARTNIQAGEEITLDQGTWNFEEDGWYTVDDERCSCGSVLCRGVLTENDWKIPEVQERYKGHFHPLIQERIALQDMPHVGAPFG